MDKVTDINTSVDELINVNLSTITTPVVKEVMGRKWIEYGTDEWRNLYPQFLLDLYYNSGTHAAIINATADMIAGQGVIIDDNDKLEKIAELEGFLLNFNTEVLNKTAIDLKLQGGVAWNIIWSNDRKTATIHHLPVDRLRIGLPNAMGKVDTYYVSADWSNTRRYKPQPIPAFNPHDRTSPNQILYFGVYSPAMEQYYTPDYVSACGWAMIDQRISEYHLNNIENGFSGSWFVSLNNGVPEEDERGKVEKGIKKKFTGAKGDKIIVSFANGKDRAAEITPIQQSDADKQYLALQELMTQNIMIGHRVTSPMLLGVKTEGQLGGRDELMQAFDIYQTTIVKPFQKIILDNLRKVLRINGLDLPISIKQSQPLTSMFTIEEMKEVMTEAELREKMGLAPLEEPKDEFSKVEKTELDTFLDTIEDIPEDWELVDEEVVDGEHIDFNFEEELNKIAEDKIELASTGRAIPERKSEQDGISKKTYDYYRVRYVYAEDEFLTRKSGKQREFCAKMMGAKKLYRKEDIDRMSTLPVNKGWGKGGADTYDIFLFKGGGNCHHFWLRQIYKTTIGESKTTKIDDAEVIGYTKARSEGFTAKKNDNRVAKPPKRMKNKGFVKKK